MDRDDRLVGVITIDDAMQVLDEEHEEDILRLAGVGDESSISDSVMQTVRQRVPWLATNIVTALAAASVIAFFEDAIAQLVALAVLMPIVASMGQRGDADADRRGARPCDARPQPGQRPARRPARGHRGLTNGVFFGVIMAAITWVWFRDPVWRR